MVLLIEVCEGLGDCYFEQLPRVAVRFDDGGS